MEEPMSKEIFKSIWDNISEIRIKEINYRVKTMMYTMIQEKKVEYDSPYYWHLSLGFDREEPIQYIYIEGFFKVKQMLKEEGVDGIEDKFIDHLSCHYQYIDISDRVNDFLDRNDELKSDNENTVFHKMELNPTSFKEDNVKTR